MTNATDLSACLKAIRAYTQRFPELSEAHHFLFDLRHCPIDDVRYVVMGQNPGERSHDHTIIDRGEESSESDFRSSAKAAEIGRPPRLEMKWPRLASSILGGNQFVQTERFFWSSSNLHKAFVDRFGTRFEGSPHLAFCDEMNRRLIAAYQPLAVVCPGLAGMKNTVRSFDLKLVDTKIGRGKRLVIHYTDASTRPWFFTPNWTGSFGLSQADKQMMAETIQTAAAC